MPDWDSMVLVGRVARTHGIRGLVVVSPETDFVAERFQRGSQVWVQVGGHESALTITDARLEGRRPVLGFDGYDSVEAAEALAGAELRVPESALHSLPEGTYYFHQLVGCRVETVAGETIGTVVRVEGGSGAAVLSIDGAVGEVLVPLAREICVGIDIEARVIRVQMPDGLRELNETKASRGHPATRGRKTRGTETP